MNDRSRAANTEHELKREPKLDRTFEQHQKLSLVADRLRLIAMAPAGWLSGASLGRLTLHELERFRSELRAHFAFEERGGYMVEITLARPELAPKIASLLAEHALMASSVDELIALAGTGDTRAGKVGLSSLLELFDAHERAERYLLLDSSSCDLGEAG